MTMDIARVLIEYGGIECFFYVLGSLEKVNVTGSFRHFARPAVILTLRRQRYRTRHSNVYSGLGQGVRALQY